MNTKPIPAIIMLTAGFVTCIVGIVQHFSFGTYVKTLLLVLIGFYLLGCIVKLVLDKGFRVMDDPLSEYEGLEIDDDLIDDLAMTDDEYQDDYQDN
ncbi:MAG: hypothetical protein ACI4EE_11480 [Lachnospiraceae bacterium]